MNLHLQWHTYFICNSAISSLQKYSMKILKLAFVSTAFHRKSEFQLHMYTHQTFPYYRRHTWPHTCMHTIMDRGALTLNTHQKRRPSKRQMTGIANNLSRSLPCSARLNSICCPSYQAFNSSVKGLSTYNK